ncbi:acetyl-CoA carboxylase, carboxyltransferase subunit beta [Candidatus Hepatobacter penaei]|uniref:acetyl-CoA carboxylase, carboxyltransferase subunit beta n=1 Tax=Candidatus Hepatobacter penaei TaxID=1274402 RepID=UPI000696D9A7|nr:acetyl-CoA carboxylase, carboxyltransferase subunit beta [Candidatus Hepatobacter penaei]TGW15765.1 acetyl-CoA carboxylase carboxyltransferase subunit beta [bacterium NHP-B]
MNWLTDLMRPKIKQVGGRNTPEDLWCRCPSCEQMIFRKELKDNLSVCKECHHHFYMSPEERCQSLFDDGHYQPLHWTPPSDDPLKFKDLKRYTERLKEARKKKKDGVALAKGKIQGLPIVVAMFDFQFIGGSLGTSAGEALVKGADTALQQKTPYVIISSSGGARMQEGILSLMQMPRTIIGLASLKEAGLPYISVLTHPTTGGVSASFASLGDINLAEPGAIIGFTGARIIQQTMRTKLPDGFQTSAFQLAHGAVDQIVHRHDLRQTLGNIASLLSPSIKKERARG